ncbi:MULTISPECIES: DUF6973 domain-containing protein [Bacillus]|uniref:DUF6973 domain-containing protein n=1 Tax=Bacillus TaxID=1386 RepID=UPI001D0EE5A1|nr:MULTISPECIES: hypothetical protein [Bacillus]WIV92362.1 hypothetical protein QNH49_23930 [Bacillus bombysepticus]MCC2363569.1 hypothetical protein [Bacillus cereus]MCU5032594.1 hypothetical protein [Bacillus cereus]MCU5317058.1 hypothetical protein [Bacillus cereus]MCU5569403.1 hypothetical protein [Bacillus cereus]
MNFKKAGIITLTSAMLFGGLLPTISHAEESNIAKLQTFSLSNMPEKAKNIDLNELKETGEEYLSEEEVRSIDPYQLNLIFKELKDEIKNGKYTHAELNQIASDKIKNSTAKSPSLYGYDIPGMPDLTEAEISLAKRHPIEFVTYGGCSIDALNEAKKYYGGDQLTKGNGDAFRHAYWNAILVPNMGGSSGAVYGEERAKAWTDAHEQYSVGIDKEMDLHNNWFGRSVAMNNYYWTTSKYSSYMRERVSKGSLARIVNNQLVATNGVTGK